MEDEERHSTFLEKDYIPNRLDKSPLSKRFNEALTGIEESIDLMEKQYLQILNLQQQLKQFLTRAYEIRNFKGLLVERELQLSQYERDITKEEQKVSSVRRGLM